MEAKNVLKLTTCVVVLVVVTLVNDLEAAPGRGYGGRQNPSRRYGDYGYGSRYSCSSPNEYNCVSDSRKGGKKVRCIPAKNLCDGFCDCPLGDDERFCGLLRPTVTVTVTVNKTEETTTTSTKTVIPTISVSSTSICTTSVNCTAVSMTTSAYPNNVNIPAGSISCSVLAAALNQALNHFVYVPSTPTSTEMVTKTLPCSATTTIPSTW